MRPLLVLTILAIAMLTPHPRGEEARSETTSVAPNTAGTAGHGTGEITSPVTAEEVLAQILAHAKTKNEERRQFDETHAYAVEKVIERRNSANRLRERTVERKEHDPRKEPAVDADDGPGYREDDFKVDQSLLDRYRFTLEGTEEVNGRPAWALEFEPVDPPLPARDLKERFLNQVAGRVWVDQGDGSTARLELRLTRPVNVVGGLVGAVKACQLLLERERTTDGLWFNAHTHWRLEGRKLLVTTVIVYDEHWSEVQQVIERESRTSMAASAATATESR